VTGRRRGDAQATAVCGGQFDRLPWRESFGVAAEPPGANHRGEHATGAWQEGATGMVEIVRVLVVAQQHGIDRADVVRTNGRRAGLLQRDMRQLILAWQVESRIGQQTKPSEFDEDRGAADQSEARAGHVCTPPIQASVGRVTR
jgi:hypothetical protein